MNSDINFWKLRPHVVKSDERFSGLCVGFEASVWREDDFVEYILDWLPEFALRREEYNNLPAIQIRRALRHAAKLIYDTDLYDKRGEFGEIILHAAIRSVFNSFPVISKVYYKSSINDTVKGFDCVHLVEDEDGLELWLGEVKFYKDFSRALNDVLDELVIHSDFSYLKNEFILISGKISGETDNENFVRKFLNCNDSMDDKIKKIRIPILLTYNSAFLKKHTNSSEKYCKFFERHIRGQYSKFLGKLKKKLPSFPSNDLKFHIFFLPLLNKTDLVEKLNKKLRDMQ